MNRFRILIAVVGLSMAAFLVAQTRTQTQTSTSSSSQSSKSSSSNSSSSASSGKSANSSANSNSGKGANSSGNGFSFQGKPTHAILFSVGQDAPESGDAYDQAIQQESKYMSDLRAKGKVVLFGPWRDLPGSMAVVMAQSDDEANQIAKNDPAVRSGNFTYEVRAWSVR